MIKESWAKIDDILLIILLAGGIINSAAVERHRRRERKADLTNSQEESYSKDYWLPPDGEEIANNNYVT